jgi:fucose 4-O-acetylase-like acetyltransferase
VAQRELYIDRLRTVMTALVVLHHTAIVYGGSGGWFWTELKPSGSPSSQLLTLLCATDQAYFMGIFFLLAGYFTPPSLERKGYGRFLADRFLRLGVPLLAFGLFLGPLTAAIVDWAEGNGFRGTWVWLWQHHQFINGPLWFAQALLIFSLVYCAWRRVFGAELAGAARTAKQLPSVLWWLLWAVGVGAGSVAVRQVVPTGENVFGLQLGFFSSYIALFALGIAAWRYRWLEGLNWQCARPWVIALPLVWLSMPVAILVASHLNGLVHSNFAGGLGWTAIFYAFWEPFVACGAIALLLLVFRQRLNQPSKLWDWLGRRAYAVYIIHPIIVVCITLAMHGWLAPPLVKFALAGAIELPVVWLVADPLVRLPLVQRIV